MPGNKVALQQHVAQKHMSSLTARVLVLCMMDPPSGQRTLLLTSLLSLVVTHLEALRFLIKYTAHLEPAFENFPILS